MSLLNRLEAALERIAEGGAERVFGGKLRQEALVQELVNVAQNAAVPGDPGPQAPNAYEVQLALADYGQRTEQLIALQAECEQQLWARLQEAGYVLQSPPSVLVTPREGLRQGVFRISAGFEERKPRFMLANRQRPQTVYRLEAPATIGRGTECSLRLSSPSVSRKHAQIEWDGQRFVVVDLESTNGTSVEGVTVSRAPLATGMTVSFGDVPLTFAVVIG
jgi:hypothetical protein